MKSKRDLEHTFRSGAMHASQEWELETNRVLWNNKPSSTEPHSRIARMAYWSGVAGGWRRRQRQRRRRRGRLEGRPRDAVYTHVSSSSYDTHVSSSHMTWKDDRETQGPRVIGHRFYLNFNVRLMSAVEAAKSSSATALSHTAHSDTARHGRREGA